VSAVDIRYHTALTDFSALQKAWPISSWNVLGNGYNPTYEQLENDEWSK
jgi:hypothetical protein